MEPIHHYEAEILSYESMYENCIWSDTNHVTIINRLRLINKCRDLVVMTNSLMTKQNSLQNYSDPR